MVFNRKAKLRDNIEAIRTVFELDNAKRQATSEKKEMLIKFSQGLIVIKHYILKEFIINREKKPPFMFLLIKDSKLLG